MKKGVGSGTGSISQRYGSGDPEQNVTDITRQLAQQISRFWFYLPQ